MHDDAMKARRPVDFADFKGEDDESLLTPETRWYLWATVSMMYDELALEVREADREGCLPWELNNGEGAAAMGFNDYLPPRFLHKCTWVTVRNFRHAFDAVVWKLGNRPIGSNLCSNVMEEFALRAIIERTEAAVQEAQDNDESPDDNDGYDWRNVDLGIHDLVFQDTDHEMLFMEELDGVETSEDFAHMHLANLKFEEWLEPFANADDAGHPMNWPSPKFGE